MTTQQIAMNPTATRPAKPQVEEKVVTKTREDLIYVRGIRAFAMIVIVTLHVAFPLIYEYNSISYGDWWIVTNFYIWGKVGSPLFTMVSGMLLLNPRKEQSIPTFFRKRFVKVLLPFLVWAGLYLLWRIYFWSQDLSTTDIIVAYIAGPAYYHLWFIQMILGLYLATPILRIYVQGASRANLTYFLGVWFIASSVLPIIERFTGVAVGIDIVVTTQYVGFFILGYYLKDIAISKRWVRPLLGVIVVAMMFTMLVTHYLTIELDGTFDNFFVLNDSFNLIVVAVSMFLLMKQLDYQLLFDRLPIAKTILMAISTTSLGIYFVHVMIIELLGSGNLGFSLSATSFNPLLAIPLTSAIAMTISVLVVMAMQRIPVVRQIVP